MSRYRCPGRVNLMGDHIDYHQGEVLPMAIEQGIELQISSAESILLQSDGQSEIYRGEATDEMEADVQRGWINYPLGVISRFREIYGLPAGFSLHYRSDLPQGAGLSSSAAMEIVTWYGLCDFFGIAFLPEEAILQCQQVENHYVGVPCGVMDQAAVTLCQKDHALLLQCRSLQHDYIPLMTGNIHWVILHTQKPRELIHSAYAERKQESDQAFALIKEKKPQSLSLSQCVLDDLRHISDPELRNRARHVITEQWRVRESARVLQLGDVQTFGRLMNASHRSLCNDYAVSGIELDTLTEAAAEHPGCLGTRMTGAGMGGCAIALVREESLESFIDAVSKAYETTIGYAPKIWTTQATGGVAKIN